MTGIFIRKSYLMQQAKRKSTFYKLAVLSAVFLAAPAPADSLSYNFLEAGYQSVNLDLGGGLAFDGEGYGLRGSFKIGDNMFGFASYADTGFDFNVDTTQLQVGLGWRTGLTDNTDFFARAAYVDVESDAQGAGSVDQDGYGVGIGVRSNVTDLIELYGKIDYVDLGSGSDSTAVAGGIWFNFSDSFALGLSVGVDDDLTSYGASARLYFGK